MIMINLWLQDCDNSFELLSLYDIGPPIRSPGIVSYDYVTAVHNIFNNLYTEFGPFNFTFLMH